jgi:predicted small lipoprotein YifL
MKRVQMICVIGMLFVVAACGKKGPLIPPDQLVPAKLQVERPK